jgi:hypothetical protein
MAVIFFVLCVFFIILAEQLSIPKHYFIIYNTSIDNRNIWGNIDITSKANFTAEEIREAIKRTIARDDTGEITDAIIIVNIIKQTKKGELLIK